MSRNKARHAFSQLDYYTNGSYNYEYVRWQGIPSMNVKDIRRANMRTLSRECGGISQMAKLINRSQSQISHLIGKNPIKNIGDRIAKQVEEAFHKPDGWLDREHFRPEEASTVTADHTSVYRSVPILTWEDIRQWPALAPRSKQTSSSSTIPGVADIGPRSFALPIVDDSMDAPRGISFPVQSTIIVDPDHDVENGNFIVARTETDAQVVFRQLLLEGNRRFLKPLNERHPIVEIAGELTIFGVVRQMTMIFD